MAGPEATEPPAPHIPYKVTSQEKTTTFTPDGRFVVVWKIYYEWPEGGVHAYVEVPENEYTPGNVDAKIEEALENVKGSHELGAQPHPENLAE